MNKYDSKFEAKVAQWLKDHKVKFLYESKSLPYFEHIYHAHCVACGAEDIEAYRTYTPDFIIANGLYLEAKGKLDAKQRKKFKAVKEAGFKIHLIFQSDSKISKNSKTRYTDWCAQHDIECCIFPNIPEAWLK